MSQSSPWRQNAHAVIIGINEYQDEKIPDLQFARADAEGVYQIFDQTQDWIWTADKESAGRA